jgi:hypothetical protein
LPELWPLAPERGSEMQNPSPSPLQAFIYILLVIGTLLFLVGLLAFVPLAFHYQLSVGLVYLGVVMILLSVLLDRLQ